MQPTAKPNIFQTNRARPAATPSQQELQVPLALYAQGRLQEAEQAARRLTVQYPGHGFGWKALGATLRRMGKTAESLVPMQKAAVLLPQDPEAYNNLGCVLQELGRLEHAEACYQRAVELKPDFANAVDNLAELLKSQGKVDDAVAVYRKKLQVTPDDGYVQHLVATLTGGQTEAAPPQYVSRMFDFYAENFDQHLKDLDYRAPSQLVDLVARHAPAPEQKWRVLDLGCGTGLVGSAIAPLARQVVGVDLSANMLAKARTRQVYQRLEQAEILALMGQEPEGSYDVIVSADVFIYLGKLDDVVRQARRLLSPGGFFAFSIENLQAPLKPQDEPDFQLEKTGRYTHALPYLSRLAAEHGFAELEAVPTALRLEEQEAVTGSLVLWTRAG